MTPTVSNFKKNVSTQLSILTFLSLFVFQFSLAQTVWTVDNRPQSAAQFTTVQAAIDAASANDIIYIHPSASGYGSITVTKTLKLVGPGHNPANSNGLRATLTSITLGNNTYPDVSGTVITGLNISSISGYNYGSALKADDLKIINNRITSTITGYFNGTGTTNWVIEGNYFDSSYTTNNIYLYYSQNWSIRNNVIEGQIVSLDQTAVITNNLFINTDTAGEVLIFVNSNGVTSPLVTNNMFVFTDKDVTHLTYSGSAPVNYTNCLVWKTDHTVSVFDPLPGGGSGNINDAGDDSSNPLFTSIPTNMADFYNNDFTLQGGSPALLAGTDGTDLGIFGRNFPFDTNGRPHSMPYPELMTILNTVVQPGQNLNVQFQASQKN